MDLFTINRYEESVAEKNPEKENDILAKLLKKAEKRKKKTEKKPKEKVEDVPEKMEIDGQEPVPVAEATAEPPPEIKDLEGFEVLGQDGFERKKRVEMVLPPWLAHPTIIETKIKKDDGEEDEPIDSIKFLSEGIKESLKSMKIDTLFPVQKIVIPWLLDVHNKPGLFRPRDICVSAPTGSGKTLAFAVPIVQMLSERVERKVRALIVLPVAELASQVFGVFKKLTQNTSLNVVMFSTTFAFHLEQQRIVEEYKGKYYSLADIIVTTPGRLVEHIHSTKGFCLKSLKFLVIDEADKIMDQVHHNWLYHLDTHVKDTTDMLLSGRVAPLCLKELQNNLKVGQPPHKLLFSATLSQDPEKLQNLRLFQPKLFTSVIGSFEEYLSKLEDATKGETNEDSKGEFIGKYTTPAELSEKYCLTETRYKPLTLFSLIDENKWTKFLVFTNSVDSAHRLSYVLKEMFDQKIRISELSATLKPKPRSDVLSAFSKGKIQGLICSDALARGIDIPDVDVVVSYDPARHIKTYIHRIGRTARAGRLGTAITLVTESELKEINVKILNKVGKQLSEEIKLSGEVDDIHAKKYSDSLDKLREHLEDVQRARTLQKQIVKTKLNVKDDKESMSLMEKLQVDVEKRLAVSAESKLRNAEGQLSKTAMKKLGMVKRNRKRKPKEDKQ